MSASVAADASPASLLETINSEVSALYEKSKDAVVKVHAQRQVYLGNLPLAPVERRSTGFFIDGDGRLLTVATAVEDADSAWIDCRGQRVDAKILGRDPKTNIALLKIDPADCAGPDGKTSALVFGNSDELKVGSMVIAIGFAYDLPSAPAVGFVAGIDIQQGAHVFITSHVRTGCKLRPGQGGGPLLNTRGEVVGVAVAAHKDDQSYALPINAAKKVCADILQHGEPRHGWVGLGIGERRKALPGEGRVETQVYIQQVFSNTPAAEVGFHDQDIILRIFTNDVNRLADVLNTMFYYRSGDRVSITILRDGKESEISLVVGPQPSQPAPEGKIQLPRMVPASKDQ